MTSIISTISLVALVGICLAEANYLPPSNGNGNGNGNILNGNGNVNGVNGNGAFGNGNGVNGNGGYTNGNGVNGNGAYVNGNGNGANGNGINGNGGYTIGNGVNGNGNGNGVYANGNGVNGNGVYANGNGVNGGYQNGNGVTVYANGIVDPFRALADAIAVAASQVWTTHPGLRPLHGYSPATAYFLDIMLIHLPRLVARLFNKKVGFVSTTPCFSIYSDVIRPLLFLMSSYPSFNSFGSQGIK
ncbi:glycine-rich cell wall structural protein-like [Penaeus monodon]|uniref:glycine-rich cell wall structural protein-like n=1 Tax=Penaeus monodon TaxID=6687 RepID=UPI0018A73AE0|nr:glycine-rich cell wall structural protein-like [Penaeus monodon]